GGGGGGGRSTRGGGLERGGRGKGGGHPANIRASSRTGDGSPSSNGEAERSPVTGDCHAGICGSPGVRFPRATRPLRNKPTRRTWSGCTGTNPKIRMKKAHCRT